VSFATASHCVAGSVLVFRSGLACESGQIMCQNRADRSLVNNTSRVARGRGSRGRRGGDGRV